MTSTARTGQTLLIASSTMLFAAFTSAMAVRRGFDADWLPPSLPPWIWATLLLPALASAALLYARPRLALLPAAALVAAQFALLAHLRLAQIADAFFLVLIAAHTAHAAAAIAALARFGLRAALFWHFTAALWLYLLVLYGVWA